MKMHLPILACRAAPVHPSPRAQPCRCCVPSRCLGTTHTAMLCLSPLQAAHPHPIRGGAAHPRRRRRHGRRRDGQRQDRRLCAASAPGGARDAARTPDCTAAAAAGGRRRHRWRWGGEHIRQLPAQRRGSRRRAGHRPRRPALPGAQRAGVGRVPGEPRRPVGGPPLLRGHGQRRGPVPGGLVRPGRLAGPRHRPPRLWLWRHRKAQQQQAV